MSMIDTFNKAIPSTINKGSELYETWFGQEDFTPEITISTSSDYNCGALANELEYARAVSQYHVQSFDLDIAAGDNLEALVETMIALPRQNEAELDATYRNRFRFIVNEKVNHRRTTKHAIKDAISYFIVDLDTIQVIEIFDSSSHYFEIRLEGVTSFDDALFLNDPEIGFLNQSYIGGPSVGAVITSLGDLIDRIKAAGVDYDINFINQSSTNIDADCIIGGVQMYKDSDGHIWRVESATLNSDAEVTT